MPAPTLSTVNSFAACVSTVADAAERAEYTSISAEVDAASQAFDQAVRTLTLHRLRKATPASAPISEERLKSLYTYRMVRRGAGGRANYDRILASAPGGICPLCSVGHASTLDHYAPKSAHPMLAVTPTNLVPACGDCNHEKLASMPNSAGEHTLHPYFDNVDTVTWLTATVIQVAPAAFKFDVNPAPAWTPVLTARVQHHFRAFGLAARFAVSAASELVGIRHGLEAVFLRGGSGAVHAHLAEQAASRSAAARNSWQAAMYTAMSQDAWFLAGGFR